MKASVKWLYTAFSFLV